MFLPPHSTPDPPAPYVPNGTSLICQCPEQQPCTWLTVESPTPAHTSDSIADSIAVLPVPFYNGSGCEELATPGGITEPQQPYTWLTDDSPMLAYTPDNIAVPPESDSEAIWQNPLPPFPQNSPSQTSTASSQEGNLSQRQTTGCEPTPNPTRHCPHNQHAMPVQVCTRHNLPCCNV